MKFIAGDGDDVDVHIVWLLYCFMRRANPRVHLVMESSLHAAQLLLECDCPLLGHSHCMLLSLVGCAFKKLHNYLKRPVQRTFIAQAPVDASRVVVGGDRAYVFHDWAAQVDANEVQIFSRLAHSVNIFLLSRCPALWEGLSFLQKPTVRSCFVVFVCCP